MPLSASQTVALTCPQCQAAFNVEVWLIIDAGERPDLAARCRDGSIHVATCPNGHSGMLGAPLLYHDRANQQLFFSYPPGMTEAQIQETGNQLVEKLRSQLLILPGSSYLDAPRAVPLELLSAAIEDRLDEAMAELQAQAEALQNDPVIGAAMRTLQEHPMLVEALLAWMNLELWQDSKVFLAARADLLTADAEQVIGAMLDLARAQNDANAVEDLGVHDEILRTARAQGVDAAYADYLVEGARETVLADPRLELEMRLAELNIRSKADLERALQEHPDLQVLMQRAVGNDPLMQALDALTMAESFQDTQGVARAYPILLSDEGLQALRAFAQGARQNGEPDAADQLETRIAMLEQIRADNA